MAPVSTKPVGGKPIGGKQQGRCPPGSLAWRQYEVKLASGRTATFGFSLADPRDKTMARVKQKHEASNLGLLVVLDDPDSIEEVVLWFQQKRALTLMSQNGAMMIGDEAQALLPRYFAVFFDEIKDIAPELADILLARVPRTGEKHLH
jgi:hypothetical protein